MKYDPYVQTVGITKTKEVLPYKEMKDRVTLRLINRKKNEELLKRAPYIPYLDLAVVFCIVRAIPAIGMPAVLIRNGQLRSWGMKKEELYPLAEENTERLYPGEFRTMRSMLGNCEGCLRDSDTDMLYVLTNQFQSFGASAILYDGALSRIGETLKEDFYVLPSSVHEMLILPASMSPGRDIVRAIVQEINETQLKEEEVLSDQVYYYSKERGELSV